MFASAVYLFSLPTLENKCIMHFTEEVYIEELYIYLFICMYTYIYIYKLFIGLILLSNGSVQYDTALGAWKSPYEDAFEVIWLSRESVSKI